MNGNSLWSLDCAMICQSLRAPNGARGTICSMWIGRNKEYFESVNRHLSGHALIVSAGNDANSERISMGIALGCNGVIRVIYQFLRHFSEQTNNLQVRISPFSQCPILPNHERSDARWNSPLTHAITRREHPLPKRTAQTYDAPASKVQNHGSSPPPGNFHSEPDSVHR